MSARAFPAKTTLVAAPALPAGASREATEPMIDQNSPWVVAMSRRAAISQPSDGARAASPLLTAMTRTAKLTRTRRLTVRVRRTAGTAVTATSAAYTVRRRPTCPSLAPRSATSTGIAPTGNSSEVTKTNADVASRPRRHLDEDPTIRTCVTLHIGWQL